MSGKIFLLQEDGRLQTMSEHAYITEERLQILLRDYPDLLAGDQIDEDDPRRWLLVSREVGVPLEEDGREWLSLDHLFIDQDGIPTLVEVKRSSDTRTRREVVGQMLDYASNAVSYWSIGRLRSQFERRCEAGEEDANAVVAELIMSSPDNPEAVESYWEQVETNLRAGKIRLVFVADEIPPELRRIVEFLNTYTSPVEVLAVEIHQYVGEGLRTLVPRVIGQTAQAQGWKRPTGSRKWDEASFFNELAERHDAATMDVAHRILDWFRSRVTRVWWGEGKRSGSFVPILSKDGTDHQLLAVWTYGTAEIYFYWYQYKEPFSSTALRQQLLDKLNAIEGVSLPDDAIDRRPGIPLESLQNEKALEEFFEAFEWVIGKIQSS